ncbi:MAG: acyltransferase [Nitrospira sp.]|nr:MAG: acyltransferase [Nitrospira sp.]
MRVGYYQFDCVFGEVTRNLDQVSRALSKVSADLLVLPELLASGYQFISKQEVLDLAEPVPDGPTTQRLMEIARARNMVLVGGLAERAGDHAYNSAVAVGPNGVIGCYRKTHLFFEETLFFTPGDTGFHVWDIGQARIGVMVCFDWFYPEAARTLALKGADILCHPANLVLPYCPDGMVTRCLENRVFSITANRIGSEERGGKKTLTFIGSSEVVTPRGQVLERALRDKEALAVVEIDPAEARKKSLNPYNDLLADRRTALYQTS